jgi:hypothetical protein
MFMTLTSFSDVEYARVDKVGQWEALGRFWSFVGRDEPHVLDLFVATPGVLPTPTVGTVYEVATRNETTKAVEPRLLGHDRKADRWFRILLFTGNE